MLVVVENEAAILSPEDEIGDDAAYPMNQRIPGDSVHTEQGLRDEGPPRLRLVQADEPIGRDQVRGSGSSVFSFLGSAFSRSSPPVFWDELPVHRPPSKRAVYRLTGHSSRYHEA